MLKDHSLESIMDPIHAYSPTYNMDKLALSLSIALLLESAMSTEHWTAVVRRNAYDLDCYQSSIREHLSITSMNHRANTNPDHWCRSHIHSCMLYVLSYENKCIRERGCNHSQ
jgi:hypothetical protein